MKKLTTLLLAFILLGAVMAATFCDPLSLIGGMLAVFKYAAYFFLGVSCAVFLAWLGIGLKNLFFAYYDVYKAIREHEKEDEILEPESLQDSYIDNEKYLR